MMAAFIIFLLVASLVSAQQTASCGDGFCDANENKQNCQRDCLSSDEDLSKLIEQGQDIDAKLNKAIDKANELQGKTSQPWKTQQQIEKVNWFIENAQDPKELERYQQQKKELEAQLKKQKDSLTYEEAKELEELNRQIDILSDTKARYTRDIGIERARINVEYYEEQIERVDWFIENAGPEELAQYQQQKKELEVLLETAEDAYGERRYKPVNWGLFAEEMTSGFLTGNLYAEFYGLAKLGSLLLSEEEVQRTRKAFRRLFCDYLHFPVAQCMVSQLCSAFPDSIQHDSTLVTRTRGSSVFSAAHVEGTKSRPIISDKGVVEILYIATYGVDNPLTETLTFSVELIGSEGTYTLVAQEQLSPGELANAARSAPLLKYLPKEYNDVCLIFNPGIRDYKGRTRTRLCSPLILTG